MWCFDMLLKHIRPPLEKKTSFWSFLQRVTKWRVRINSENGKNSIGYKCKA